MRAAIAAALVLACTTAHAQDSWTGADKKLHVGAGMGIAVVGLVVTRNPHEAFIAGVAAGAVKEFYDMRHLDKHTPSWKDFAVTAGGALVGAYVPGLILGPGFIGYRREF